MAKACRFRGRREREKAVRLHLTVPGFAFSRPETGRVMVGCPVVVSIVAPRSSLGIAPSFPPLFDPDRDRIGFVIVDFLIPAVRLFVVAGTGSAAAAAAVVVVVVVVVAAAVAAAVAAVADLVWIADSAVCPVCSSAEATAKARAVAARS